MQNKKLVIFLIILCAFLNILVAGVLMQKTDDSSNVGKATSEPTARMIYSFPSQSTANTSSSLATSEKLVITNVQSNDTSDTFLVTILNNGPSHITITDVLVNGYSVKIENKIVISPNSCDALLVTLNDEIVFLRTYEIKVQSLEGYSAIFYNVCC